MVRTLIKHEILRTGPMMGLILGVGALVLLGSGFLCHLNIPVISVVFGVFGLFLVGGMWPFIQLVLAVDFWRTSWGRMGYLTHSFPVRGSVILGARTSLGCSGSGDRLGVDGAGLARDGLPGWPGLPGGRARHGGCDPAVPGLAG